MAPGGTSRTVAGTGKVPPTAAVHDGVPGTQFDLASPADLAVGPDRSLHIADIGLFRVFGVAPDGRITLVAGDGVRGYTGDGGSATDAEIGAPAGLAVGSDGTVYFGDPDNQRVRAVTPNGAIATVAGNGNAQLDAAGGPAAGVAVPTAASLSPDQTGDVWMVDSGYLRRFGGGHLVTVTEPGQPAGQRWGISDAAKWPRPETPLSNVGMVAVDRTTVYVLTAAGLQRLDVGQRLETVAGVGDYVFGPVVAAAGAVYLVDRTGNQVYVTHPTPPPAAAPGGRSSTPWWPFVVGCAGFVVLILIIFWVRRAHRPAR